MQSVYEMECSEAIALVSVLREDYLAAAFFDFDYRPGRVQTVSRRVFDGIGQGTVDPGAA